MKRAIAVLVIFLTGVSTGVGLDDWLDIDRCLDRGGAWDYERDTCRYE